MNISLITVGYKSCEYIRGLLESLFAGEENLRQANLTVEHFIIDNASDDGLVEMVNKEFVPRKSDVITVHAIQNAANLGFAKANNLGIKEAQGEKIILVNPDMRLFPDTLPNICAWMDAHPNSAITGIHLLDQNGAAVPHVRRFPTWWDQAIILLKLPHIFPHLLDNYLVSEFDYNKEMRVDSIRGSFFALRRSTVEKIGGLDERYFIWFEEIDYCRKAAAAGLEVWYTPAARAVDFVGRSFALVGGFQKQKYFTDSMVKYFNKWHPVAAPNIRFLRWLALAAAWLAEKFQK